MQDLVIKDSLHELIDRIDDPVLLQAVYTLLNRYEEEKRSDFWEDLSPVDQAAIDEGIADADRGDLLTSEELAEQIARMRTVKREKKRA